MNSERYKVEEQGLYARDQRIPYFRINHHPHSSALKFLHSPLLHLPHFKLARIQTSTLMPPLISLKVLGAFDGVCSVWNFTKFTDENILTRVSGVVVL